MTPGNKLRREAENANARGRGTTLAQSGDPQAECAGEREMQGDCRPGS